MEMIQNELSNNRLKLLKSTINITVQLIIKNITSKSDNKNTV